MSAADPAHKGNAGLIGDAGECLCVVLNCLRVMGAINELNDDVGSCHMVDVYGVMLVYCVLLEVKRD